MRVPACLIMLYGLCLCIAAALAVAVAQPPLPSDLELHREESVPKDHRMARLVRLGVLVIYRADMGQLPQRLSKPLSTACALGRFNQRVNLRLFLPVVLVGGKPKRFGFAAMTGGDMLNLYDPQGLGEEEQAYLFDLDRTSDCRVYVYKVT